MNLFIKSFQPFPWNVTKTSSLNSSPLFIIISTVLQSRNETCNDNPLYLIVDSFVNEQFQTLVKHSCSNKKKKNLLNWHRPLNDRPSDCCWLLSLPPKSENYCPFNVRKPQLHTHWNSPFSQFDIHSKRAATLLRLQ